MGDSQRPQQPLQHPPEVKGRVLRSSTGFKSWFSSRGSSHNSSKNAQGAYAGPVDGEAGSHRSQTWSAPGKSDQEEGAMSVPSYNLSEEALRCFLQEKWPGRGFTIVHRHDNFVIIDPGDLTEEDKGQIYALRRPPLQNRRPSH